MNRIVLAASAVSALAMMAAPAFAGDLTVSGTVTAVCTVSAPANEAVALSGSTTLPPLSIHCNDPQGFTATVSSAKGGVLKDADTGNRDSYGYKLAITGLMQATSLASPVSVSSVSARTQRAYVTGPQEFPMSLTDVTLSGAGFAGTYSDTITFTISGT